MNFFSSLLINMTYFYKIVCCLVLISYSFATYAEQIVPPISINDLPSSIQDKSPQELADIMSHIASWSYQALLKVPTHGLKNQQASLEQIIVLRKWLEAKQHPLFQLLASHLIMGVDGAILNEVFRQEMLKHGITTSLPAFKTDSLDEPLLKRLLSLNDINEQALIDYVISLDGKVATYCQQQNYSIDDYTSSAVLDKFSDEIKNHNEALAQSYIDAATESPVFFLHYAVAFSKPLLNDFLFIKTLGLIYSKQHIRLLTDIYFENGLPSSGQALKNLIETKLLALQPDIIRYNFTPDKIIHTFSSYVEHERSPSYGLGKTGLLLPFISNPSIIPTKYVDELQAFEGELQALENASCIGLWLMYLEDITVEDKEKIQHCGIVDKL